MSETRICPQCERRFTPKAKHQIYDVGPCRYQGWIQKEVEAAQADSQRVEGDVHPLAEARACQEQADLKSKLSQIIYEGIVDRLKLGPVHADDLEHLWPAESTAPRELCRRLVGAQFGSLASRGYIVERERRKSKVPSRKGAKSGVFEFTRKGREKLIEASAGLPARGRVEEPDEATSARLDDAGPPSTDPRRADAPWKPEPHCQCGCGKPIHRFGARYRPGHYNRSRTPEYAVDQQTGCWIWQGAMLDSGYGRKLHCFSNGTRHAQMAHRYIYEEYVGPIPDGLHLDHLCRNRRCVNPEHLEPVTQAENNRRQSNTKLTIEDARAIRASSLTNVALAEQYGVSNGLISEIRSGKKWREVDNTLTGVGGGCASGSTPSGFDAPGHSLHSGEEIPGGRDQAQDSRPEPVDAAPGEPTQLFEADPPSAYDPWESAA